MSLLTCNSLLSEGEKMSKIKETKKRVKEFTVTTEVKCDICGAIAPCPDCYDAEWAKESYNISTATIELKEGASFPAGGSWIETTFDICPTCFKEKLIPFIKSFGGEPTIREVDF